MINFDTFTSGNATGTSSTIAHTCSGNNRLLVVGVGTDASGDVITGVTYNGVAMTLVDKQQMAGAATRYAYLFYLLNPDSGTNDIVISASPSHNIRSDHASYTGVKQTGQPDASSKATNASTTDLTNSTTVVLPDSWIVSFGQAINAVPVAGTGLTSRGTEGINCRIADSNGGLAVGAQAMHWTRGAADSINSIQASFAPEPDGGGYIFIQP